MSALVRKTSLKSEASILALTLGISFLGGQAMAGALPSGGQYIAGKGSITKSTGSLVVNQTSTAGIIDWNSFSVGKNSSVQFDNGNGATLNRVTGGNLSHIAGSLNATGAVYLINPQGVVVNASGKIVTGDSFVASSQDTNDGDFLSGRKKLTFAGNSTGDVINRGTIASQNGDVVLIGNNTINRGTLSAKNGVASMAAGDDVLMRPAGGDRRLFVKAGSGNVTNSGTVEAASVELRAADGNVYALAGNSGGLVSATGTQNIDGHVWLTSGTGNADVAGNIAAHNADGSGGTVVATGRKVSLTNTADLSASGTIGGTVLIGGDVQGGAITANNLVSAIVPAAQSTMVAQGARISADGSHGGGGNIVIWSDGRTSYDGTISAKGQSAGGFAEVSSHDLLAFNGSVNLTTALGQTGTLLLDPENVEIAAAADSRVVCSAGVCAPTGNTSVLDVTTLENALATANVEVTTGGTGSLGSQAGNITVLAPITWSTTGLTLNAYHSINIDAAITGTDATVTLIAGGAISQNSVGAITTKALTGSSAGSTTLNAANAIGALDGFTTDNGSFSLTDAGPLDVAGTVNLGTGKLTLITVGGEGALTIDAALTGSKIDLVSSEAIAIDDSVKIAGAASLTLDAAGTLAVNAPIAVSGAGSVALGAGYDTTTIPGTSLLELSFGQHGNLRYNTAITGGKLTINGAKYTLVDNIATLAKYIYHNPSGDYALASDYDATGDGTYAKAPIRTTFSGTFEGLGNTISNLTMSGGGGLFGEVGTQVGAVGVVADLRLTDVNVSAACCGGTALAGGNEGILQNDSVSGTITVQGAGSFVGALTTLNYGTIFNSYEDAYLIAGGGGEGAEVGGLVGLNGPTGVIYGSHQSGKILAGANSYVGGLAAQNAGLIANSYATGNVIGTQVGIVGGIVGANMNSLNTAILDSYSTASVRSGNGSVIGGIAGDNAGVITDSYSLGSVTGGSYTNVGGLVGSNAGIHGYDFSSISGSYANGPVTVGDDSIAGGLVGDNGTIITNSYSTAAITGGGGTYSNYYGGLVGENRGTITASYATGSVQGGTHSHNGGLVGYGNSGVFLDGTQGGTISDDYATGSVTGGKGSANGGLIGFEDSGESPGFGASVIGSFATGAVSGGDKSYDGGLTGFNNSGAAINASYSTGSASGGLASFVGGLVGYNFGQILPGDHAIGGTITASYSTGTPMGGAGSYVGGLVGDDLTVAGYIADSYWDTTTSRITDLSQGAGNISNDPGIEGLTTVQLLAGLPLGFDPSIWSQNASINDGLPYLLANSP